MELKTFIISLSIRSNDDTSDEFWGFVNHENYDKYDNNRSEIDDFEEPTFIRSEYESSHMALKSSYYEDNEAKLSSNMLFTVSSARTIGVEPLILLITVLAFIKTYSFISFICQG